MCEKSYCWRLVKFAKLNLFSRRQVSSCELTEHSLHKTRTHNFDNDVVITIIEQIKRSDMLIERIRKK